jgi:hypothetical protein
MVDPSFAFPDYRGIQEDNVLRRSTFHKEFTTRTRTKVPHRIAPARGFGSFHSTR